MSSQTLMLISMLIPVAAVIAIIVILIVSKNKGQSYEQQELAKLQSLLPKGQNNNGRDWARFTSKMYPYLQDIPFVRELLSRIQRRLGVIYAGDDTLVRTKSSAYTMIILAVSVLIMILAFILSDSWTTRLAIILAMLYIGGLLHDRLIENAELMVLREEDQMIKSVRHEYHKTHMVTDSLEKVGEESKSKIISLHAEKIADILNDDNPEDELNAYYDVAPNRHMKQLAGISFKVAEYGDSDMSKGEKSFYLSSLNNIREEIGLDIHRRMKLNRLLAGLIFIAVAPIFMIDPIRRWGEHYFPIISNYYNSAWGMYSLVLLYIIFITSYIVLRIARKVEADTQGVKDEGKWLNRLLKVKWISKLIDRIAPSTHEASHFKVTQAIKKSNSKLNVRSFYLWKCIFFTITFLSMIVIQISVHSNTKANVLYPNQAIETNGQSSGQVALTEERYAFESVLILDIVQKKIPPEQVVPYIVEQSKGKVYLDVGTDMQAYAEGLAGRVSSYQNNFYKWYELIIAFVIALASYIIPNAYLIFKQSIRRWEMQNEVDGFNTSIMMLSNIKSISVYEILDWMHRDSFIFKEQLMNCLLDYEAGAYQALEALKDEAHFEPLERLVERLQEAEDHIGIKEAFDDMEIERQSIMEQRKEHYETLISRKHAIGKLAGFTPFGATIVLYLFTPFVYLMYEQLGDITVITGGM